MDAPDPQSPKPNETPAGPVPTPSIISAMLRAAKGTSDLIFSPGRAPQIEVNGQLVQLKIPGVGVLTPGRHRAHCRRLDRTQRAGRRKTEGARLLRHFVQPAEGVAVSRERVHAARELRDCHARDPDQRSRFRHAEPSLPARRLLRLAQRNRAGHGPDGQRQVLHAGRHRGQDQRREGVPHHYHRGPHRISALPQARDDPPARAALRHAQLSRSLSAPLCGRRPK